MLTRDNKKLSCRREAARCYVFVCSQLQHTYSAVFLLPVTAASDLLVHKILLNSVLLFPIEPPPVQTPLRHNPLVCCRSWVGWGQEYGLVSVIYKNTRRVLSYNVPRQQKTGDMTNGVVPGGLTSSGVARNLIWGVYVLTSFKTCVNVPHVNKTITDLGCVYTDIPPVATPLLTSSPAYNVEPVTKTSSSSCANNGRRTPRCARRSPPSIAALFFTLRDSYG